MSDFPSIIQLKVTLLEIEPPIWRRLLVPQSTTLGDLHHILQAAFGWLDYHLHEFQIGGLRFGDPDVDDNGFDEDPRVMPETEVRLADFARGAPGFVYVYDFGDNWRHQVEFEERAVPSPGRKYPACIGGERSRPPEDVGGVRGYREFLEIFHDQSHPEHRAYRTWAGRTFGPEVFDLEKTDRAVRSAVRTARRRQAAGGYG